MARRNNNSRGAALAARIHGGRLTADRAPRPGARSLPVIHGVTPGTVFSRPQENVLADTSLILVDSQRVFRYGNSVTVESDGEQRRLKTIADDDGVDKTGASRLANFFICEEPPASDDDPPRQYPPPERFCQLLLNSEPVLRALPEIRTYAKRPIIDDTFAFRGPGWHADAGILIHGPDVEPTLPAALPASGPALDRLPPRLRGMLADFCFRTDADLVNAVGTMLTGMMPSVFQRRGKAVVLIDGNQPGVGKTLLARAIGMLLDGEEAQPIHFTPDDEELAKRICAELRCGTSSVVLIDNAKVRAGASVNSPVLEANSMAPTVSLRILGQSATLARPNEFLLRKRAGRFSADWCCIKVTHPYP